MNVLWRGYVFTANEPIPLDVGDIPLAIPLLLSQAFMPAFIYEVVL